MEMIKEDQKRAHIGVTTAKAPTILGVHVLKEVAPKGEPWRLEKVRQLRWQAY